MGTRTLDLAYRGMTIRPRHLGEAGVDLGNPRGLAFVEIVGPIAGVVSFSCPAKCLQALLLFAP